MLENRDYTLIVDKSGSMSIRDCAAGMSRWQAAQETTSALARKCEEYDPDGLTLYVFSGGYKKYENVTSSKVEQIFKENEPAGGTDLASVLNVAFNDYFARKASGQTKANGETILVITDGEPNDKLEVFRAIVKAANAIEKDEELALTLVQIGSDAAATKFLKAADDQLKTSGAKFDICDTITLDAIESGDLTLTEVLLNAISD